jgi:hydroxymethylpyrimidine pyrophosphatase-like HAD family hydrolase
MGTGRQVASYTCMSVLFVVKPVLLRNESKRHLRPRRHRRCDVATFPLIGYRGNAPAGNRVEPSDSVRAMPNRSTDSAYRLVALDIDGTVLNSAQEVTPELREVLALLAQRGVRTVLSTGRRWRNTVSVLREMGHVHPVAVCCGGALIKEAEGEQTLLTAPMKHATARLTARLFRECGLVPMLLYDRPLSGRELKLAESDRARAESLPYLRMNPGSFDWYAGDYPDGDEPPLVAYTVDDGQKVRRAEGPIVEGLGELGIVKVMAQRRYGPDQVALEVHDPKATKWHALEWLLEQWGVRAEEVVAIGDDVNDLPMLEAAGLSVAMGNAVPEVKALADTVTTSNDEHGAALALRKAFEL